jgi:predicted dehydrogenase
MNRRRFLQSTAAGLALSTVSYAAVPAATKPRRVALIGCGWYGKNDLFRLIQVDPVEVVALCDVDSKMLSEAAGMVSERQASHNKPQTYGDYRKLLAEHELDIVLVGTPDHWHALPMIAAVEAGADVYVQKPISVDIAEGQSMVAAARKHDRVVQVGTQRRSTPHLALAKKRIIEDGKLGKVGHVDICCYYHMRAQENPPDTAPPEHLDYEMWTGPAPMRPYNRLCHPRRWRSFTEYGNGIVGDMCIHMLDMVRWMLDLGWPTRVSSTGGIYVQKDSKANISDTQTATFDFDELPVVWQHRTWGHAPDPDYPWAAFLYGDKGTLKASVNKWEFFPAGKKEPSESGEVLYEREQYPEDLTERDMELHVASANRAHQRDFLAAIDARTKPVADIEQGYISTASCILANLSMRLGRSLAWDAAAGKIVADEEANALLARPYRSPWERPRP